MSKHKKCFTFFLILPIVLTMIAPTAFADYFSADYLDYFIDKETVSADNEGRIKTDSPIEKGEVRTGKKVSVFDASTGEFEITLEAIGRRFETTAKREVPVVYDVVFVLDYSSGMDADGKLTSMKYAAMNAINQILGNNTSEHYNRAAVVRYADGASTLLNWRQSAVNFTDLRGRPAGSETDSRTNTMAGMNQAYQLLNARSDADKDSRPAIIVLMSDGQPNGYYENATNHALVTSAHASYRTTGNGMTADADNNSVYYTIACIQNIHDTINAPGKIKFPGGLDEFDRLTIYSIGFDLDSFTGTQRDYAYAVLYPSPENLGKSSLRTVRDRLGAGFTNPVSAYLSAASDLSSITKAFTHIIESIVYNDPIGGNMVFYDMIDDAFELVHDSFSLNGGSVGEIPGGVSITGGLLKWSFLNLETLDANDPADGWIGERTPSSLRFRIRLKDSALNWDNDGVILYTNTKNYSKDNTENPNYAYFAPLSNNPYYYTASGTARKEVSESGHVRHNLLSTGMLMLGFNEPAMPSVNLRILKEVRNASGQWAPSASFTGPGRDIDYRIRVWGEADNENLKWSISGNIADNLNLALDGKFVIGNEYGLKTEAVFTYTLPLTAGTHVNTALIELIEYPETEFHVPDSIRESSATVIIGESVVIPPGTTPGSNLTPSPVPRPGYNIPDLGPGLYIIPDMDVPLTELPPETVEIPEEKVPLEGNPYTGGAKVPAMTLPVFGALLIGTGAVLKPRGKKR